MDFETVPPMPGTEIGLFGSHTRPADGWKAHDEDSEEELDYDYEDEDDDDDDDDER